MARITLFQSLNTFPPLSAIQSPNTFPPLSAIEGILFRQTGFSNYYLNFPLPCLQAPFRSLSFSKFNTIFTGLSSVLNTCRNHLCAFVFADISVDTVRPSIVINLQVFFLSINFTSHMMLNIAFSVLLKIATSLSFRHYVLLLYSMADCSQL